MYKTSCVTIVCEFCHQKHIVELTLERLVLLKGQITCTCKEHPTLLVSYNGCTQEYILCNCTVTKEVPITVSEHMTESVLGDTMIHWKDIVIKDAKNETVAYYIMKNRQLVTVGLFLTDDDSDWYMWYAFDQHGRPQKLARNRYRDFTGIHYLSGNDVSYPTECIVKEFL